MKVRLLNIHIQNSMYKFLSPWKNVSGVFETLYLAKSPMCDLCKYVKLCSLRFGIRWNKSDIVNENVYSNTQMVGVW
jgi:hypothetical protein